MHCKQITFFLIITILITGCGFGEEIPEEFTFPQPPREKQQIVIGRVPSETVIQVLQQLAPLIELLEDELEVDIQFKFSFTYDEIIKGMQSGDYDLAFLGPLAYVEYENSVDRIEYNPILKPIRFGADHYRAIIFTHQGSGISSLEQLRGKRIAFVDQNSASGYLFPLAKIKQAGINPDVDMEEVAFLYRHNVVVRNVYEQNYEVGATYKDARPDALQEEINIDEALPVIAETNKIPSEPVAISLAFKNNYPELSAELITMFLNLEEHGRGRIILERLGIENYVEARAEDYEPVRDVIQTLRGN